MSWAVGEDPNRHRHIGYGVPATCDHNGCGAQIDRGLSYACGGGVVSDQDNCGLFFCSDHLHYALDGATRYPVCERCLEGLPPFEPSPDTAEWISHVLLHQSWSRWRDENPEWTQQMLDQQRSATRGDDATPR